MPLEFPPMDHLWESVVREWAAVKFGSFNSGDAVSHATLFIPYGLLLSHIQYHHSEQRFKTGLILVILLAVVSELMQLFVQLRTCSGMDLVMDYIGLALGLGAGIIWHRQPQLRAMIDKAFNDKLLYICIALLVASYSYRFMPVEASFENWKSDFPLIMGNEEDGSRPWNGDIYQVALFDRLLSEREANNLSSGKINAESLRPVLYYDFSSSTMTIDNDRLISVTEANHNRSETTLRVHGNKGTVAAIVGGGVSLRKGGALRIEKLPENIYKRIVSNNRMSLFAQFQAATELDTGPARIVSLSDSVDYRNFTLGQSMDVLNFRVRTTFSGVNGTEPALTAKGCITPLETQATVSVFTGTASQVYVNGSLCDTQVYDRLSSSGPTYLVVPWNSLGTAAILFLGWSVFAIAYLAALRKRPETVSQKLQRAAILATITIAVLVAVRYLLR